MNIAEILFNSRLTDIYLQRETGLPRDYLRALRRGERPRAGNSGGGARLAASEDERYQKLAMVLGQDVKRFCGVIESMQAGSEPQPSEPGPPALNASQVNLWTTAMAREIAIHNIAPRLLANRAVALVCSGMAAGSGGQQRAPAVPPVGHLWNPDSASRHPQLRELFLALGDLVATSTSLPPESGPLVRDAFYALQMATDEHLDQLLLDGLAL